MVRRTVVSLRVWFGALIPVALILVGAPSAGANFQFAFEVPDPNPESEIGVSFPADIALDPEGNVWIVDCSRDRFQKFDGSGELLDTFGTSGVEPGELSAPCSISIDPEGDIWIADTANHRIQEFDDEGEPLRVVGELGSGSGQFAGPLGIAVDAEGHVWVAEYGNGRVQELDAEGEFVQVFGGEVLDGPSALDIGPDGNVWVADEIAGRVTVFDENGAFVRHVGTSGKGQLEGVTDIDVDPEGNVWVATGPSRVHRYDENGDFISRFGHEGSGPGEFLGAPSGLEADGEGSIWVVDGNNQRVQKWGLGDPVACAEETVKVRVGTPLNLGEGLPCEGTPPFEFELINLPEHGELSEFDPETGAFTYTPEPGYRGADFIVYEVNNSFAELDETKFEFFVGGALTGYAEHQLNFGEWGNGGGRFQHPADVAVGPEDHVYVLDSTLYLVQEFTPKGEFVAQFGTYGDDPGELNHPSALAFGPDGNLWIADTGNNRVQKFTPKGEYLDQFGSFGAHVASAGGPGEFKEPRGIAVDSSGNVYVADTGNRRVQKFDEAGEFLDLVVFTGEFGPPPDVSGIYIEPTPRGIAVGPEGHVWVSDRKTIGLVEFTSDLEYVGATSSPNLRRPDAVGVDPFGNVWAGDEGNNRVVRFDSYGDFVDAYGKWSGFPEGNFDFRFQFGIDVDTHNRIWITDPANYRVQRWVDHTGQVPVCEEGESATTAVGQPLHLEGDAALGCEGEWPLSYELLVPPEHGEISGSFPPTPDLTYTPDPEYRGPDSFTYQVENKQGKSGEATFEVEVGEAPSCESQQTSTPVEEELEVELSCTGDYDEDAYQIVKAPLHGEISGFDPEAGTLTYTPDTAFQGTDKFTFQRRSWIHSSKATVTIGVCEPPSLEVGGAIADPEAPGVDLSIWAWPDSWLCPGVSSLSISIDEEVVYSENRDCGRYPDGCVGMEMVRQVQLPFAQVLGNHEYEIEAEDEFGHPAEPELLSKETDEAETVWDLDAEVIEEGECSNKPHLIGSVMVGTKCDDTIKAKPNTTLYRTGDGKDEVIYGDERSETFETGAGDDIVIAGRGSDIVRSGADDDRVFGGSGDDKIFGGPGEDTLVGGPGADEIKGAAGNDLVRGGATTDKLYGGDGAHNTLSYADAVTPGFYFFPGYPPLVTGFPDKHDARGVYVNLSTKNAVGDNGEVARYGGGADEIPNGDFQDVVGSPFADLIIGSDEANEIDGGAGTDIIRGRGETDTIDGGPDQDYLDGGIEEGEKAEDDLQGDAEAPADYCLAGTPALDCELPGAEAKLNQPEMKTVSVGLLKVKSTGKEQSVYIRGTAGRDEVEVSGDATTVTVEAKAGTLEAVAGCELKGEGSKKAECNGTRISSILMWGGAGKDALVADGFKPEISVTLLGGDGADHLTGSPEADDVLVDGRDEANDHLFGRDGDDTLFSNEGKDTLLAGPGGDLFVSASICDGDQIAGGPAIDNANWAQLMGPEIEPANNEFPAKMSEDIFGGVDRGVIVRIGAKSNRVNRKGKGCKDPGESKGRISGVEDLEGSGAADVLAGDEHRNILLGRGGADVLLGRAGDDSILANNANRSKGKKAVSTRERHDLDKNLECGDGDRDGIKLDKADKNFFYPKGKLDSCETPPGKMIQRSANYRLNPVPTGEPEEEEPGTSLALDEQEIGAVADPDAPGPVGFFKLDETSGTAAVDWMSPDPLDEEGEEEEAEEEAETEEEAEETAEEEPEESWEEEHEEEAGETAVGAYEGGVVLDQEGAIEESRAVELDGVDDFLDLTSQLDPASFVTNNGGMNVSGYSVEMWVKFAAEPSAREELFSRTAGVDGLSVYRAADGRVKFSVVDGVEAPVVATDEPVDDGEWHQIVAVMAQRGEPSPTRMSGSAEDLESLVSPVMILYVDGFPQVLGVGAEYRSVIPEGLASAKNLVGARLTSGGLVNWLSGSVDDVAIYGHPLTFNEVQEHLTISEAVRPSAYLEPSVDLKDTDEDGIVDSADNCAEVANEGQEDADLDGVGDACEPALDEDEDGVVDELDNCPQDFNPLQEDLDENSVGDACEATEEEEEEGE